jgi:lysophospholipase L1-like esterase
VLVTSKALFGGTVFGLPVLRSLRGGPLLPRPKRAARGEYIVALGDSITAGVGDEINERTPDPAGRRNRKRGFTPILSELLSFRLRQSVEVVNEGVGGTTAGGCPRSGISRLMSTEARHTSSRYWLIMFGTNDSGRNVPSGKDLQPGDYGYHESFKDYMQRIITSLQHAKKIPILAKVPAITNVTPARDRLIRDYNIVIDQLVASNELPVTPPNFYAHFERHPEHLCNGIHPNRSGYEAMARLWCEALVESRIVGNRNARSYFGGLAPRLVRRVR